MKRNFSEKNRKRGNVYKNLHFTKVIIYLFSFLSVGFIFYLSWLPNGMLGKETALPQWILDWSNTNFNVRTAIPFLVLGYLLALNQKVYVAFVICLFIVCIAELGQIYLPGRNADLKDVFYGALGTIIGIGISKLIHRKSHEVN
jgi:glycopeptide antibiotics resistance protein